MKHFLLMLAVTVVGGVVSIAVPFWGVMLYYGFGTLRPQYLWEWSLSQSPQIRWSLTAGLIAIVALLVNLPTVLRTFRGNKVFALLLVYAGLMLLSLLTAFNPKIAMFWVQEYGKVFLMAFVATLVIQRFWQVRAMGVMIALCLGYIAYEVNYLYIFEGGRLDIYHRGYGGLDNNGAGAMLILGLPFAYFLAVSPVGSWAKVRRFFAAALGLVILHAVMVTYSRGAMLGAAVALIWLLLHHRPRIQSAGIAALLGFAVMFLAGDEIRDRFMSTADYETDASAMSRFDSWEAAFEIALAHPLTGKGVRNSNEYSQNYGADLAGRTIHNQYLQIAADSGFPAAGIYITMIGVAVIGLGLARKRALQAESDFAVDPLPKNSPFTREELVARARDASTLCLAMQTAVLTFSFTSLFLSVELVELPWLLVVLAGVLPAALDRRLDGLGHGDYDEDDTEDDDGVFTPTPARKFKQGEFTIPERYAA